MNFEGFWYLIALQDDILKKYYLKNISHPKLLESTFESEEELEELLDNSLSVWFQRDIEPFEVKLYADKFATKYFKRRPLPTQKIDAQDSNNGTMEFTVTITHEMEILPIVKYWIPRLYVIEPQWIKEMIEDDVKEYFETSRSMLTE